MEIDKLISELTHLSNEANTLSCVREELGVKQLAPSYLLDAIRKLKVENSVDVYKEISDLNLKVVLNHIFRKDLRELLKVSPGTDELWVVRSILEDNATLLKKLDVIDTLRNDNAKLVKKVEELEHNLKAKKSFDSILCYKLR